MPVTCHCSNIAHTRAECPKLSLNRAPGSMSVGWRPQVKLVRVIKTYYCMQGPHNAFPNNGCYVVNQFKKPQSNKNCYSLFMCTYSCDLLGKILPPRDFPCYLFPGHFFYIYCVTFVIEIVPCCNPSTIIKPPAIFK